MNAFGRLKMEHVVMLMAVFVGVAVGSARLIDNSFLTHLVTGLGILDTGHIPRTDPYSFTAHGQPWVVQSWLAEVVYAALYRGGGDSGHLLIVLNMAVYGVVAALLAVMARTGNWLKTLLILFIGIGMGVTQWWAARPTEFGLLLFALTVFNVSRRGSVWWFVPIAVLWTNTHGTWALASGWLIASAVGARFDSDADFKRALRCVMVFVPACLVSAVLSPAGWKNLLFPLIPLGDRSAIFKTIAEWMSPNFASGEFASTSLVALLTAFVVLMRAKVRWSDVLPLVVLLSAALIGSRNLPLLGVAVVPVLASLLRAPTREHQRASKHLSISEQAGLPGAGVAAILTAGIVVVVAFTFAQPAFAFKAYPVKAVDYASANGLVGPNHRVYAADFVGNYLTFRFKADANVFIDDRYDMYPARVSRDSIVLGDLKSDPQPVIDRYGFDVMILQKSSRMAQWIKDRPAWRSAWQDDKWVVYRKA